MNLLEIEVLELKSYILIILIKRLLKIRRMIKDENS